MRKFSISPKEMIASPWRNRDLVRTLTKREVFGRYKGSVLGILWSFFNPIFMLLIYTFVFSVVLKARWGGGDESKAMFALVLFSGLMMFNLFSECINRAPSLIVSNPNYVKKVIFPLEILPWVSMRSAIFHLLMSLVVWLVAYLFIVGTPTATALLFPVVFLPLAFFTMGFTWLLASLGVYLRDVVQVVGILTTALLFLSPIFYPISALPEKFQKYLLLNPMTPIIEQTRGVLILGQSIDWPMWWKYLMISVLIAWLGFAWFQKTRKGFADVI